MQILDRRFTSARRCTRIFPSSPGLDLGALEAADRQARPAVRGRPGRCTAGTRRARLLVSRARRILPTHARGRRHVARSRARRRDRAAERRGRGSHVRQDAQRGQARRLHRRLRIRARDEGVAAGDLGLRLLCSLLLEYLRPPGSVPEGWSWPEARDDFIHSVQRRALGPSTASGARGGRRSIPCCASTISRSQLGSRQVSAAHPGDGLRRTPHIAVELASDKEETNKILASLGLPVPRQSLVQNEGQAVRAAKRIGYPVVTKPYNGNHGRGSSSA